MMEWTKMKQRRLIIAGSAAAFVLASSNAWADTPRADLDVKATLTAAMTIECNRALNFGELIVPVGDRGSVDVVQIEAGEDAKAETVDGSENVSLAGDSQSGKCTISGGDDGQKIKIALPDEVKLKEGESPLSVAPEDSKEGEKFELDGSGEGSVHIGGELEISNDLSSGDFQDYETSLTVEVNDDP
ncbi:DUF4402 domain-containing protein [Spiribacter roseus]|uniref:DUF4402 domain-containing protein n=1 Tax=Spiribacter roseus TaxID=1855875 RepID=UPI0011D0F245